MKAPSFVVLVAVCMYLDVIGYPASLDDLAEITGLHRSTVDYHLDWLERAGYLTSTSQPRSTVPTVAGRAVIPVANASERTAPRAVTPA